MKKVIALIITGLVLLSGCSWFQQQPAANNEMVEDDKAIEEEEQTEDTSEFISDEEFQSITDIIQENEQSLEEDSTEPANAEASSDSPEVALAKCITESGTKLYTASWCGHCKNQKEAFGEGLAYLDNTECAEGDGWAQACTDAGVKAVPTWIFGDGTSKSGDTPLSKLAELTGCTYNN